MNKGILVCCALALLTGCKVSLNTPTQTASAAAPALQRQPGMWQSTTIQIQKYRNALFREKATGKQVDPAVAQTMPVDAVALEGGDFDELFYSGGRLRYAFYGRDSDEQPFVTERALTSADFDQLDQPFYDDRFFNLPAQNWDAQVRLPLFVVHYEQGGKAYESSFTPSLNKLPKLAAEVDALLGQMDGDTTPPKGVTQTSYAMSAQNGTLTVTLTQTAIDSGGDAVETPLAVTGVQYDVGQGKQTATLVVDPKKNVFSLPLPAGSKDFPFVKVALSITPAAPQTAWNTIIPVRGAVPGS